VDKAGPEEQTEQNVNPSAPEMGRVPRDGTRLAVSSLQHQGLPQPHTSRGLGQEPGVLERGAPEKTETQNLSPETKHP
jgi:hypothetical protein